MFNATSQDLTQPALSGVLIHPEGDTFRLCATDGHRVHTAKLTIAPDPDDDWTVDKKTEMLLSPQLCRALLKLPKDEDVWLKVISHEDHIVAKLTYTSDDEPVFVDLTARNLDGPFPDTRDVYPKRSKLRETRFLAVSLIDALGNVLKSAGGETQQVTFEANGKDSVKLASRSDESKCEQSILVFANQPRVPFALNGRYVLDILKGVSSGDVTFNVEYKKTKRVETPMIVTCTERPNREVLIMPQRLWD